MPTTLATLRDRVEATLQDATNATWSTDDIDEGIRQALQQYTLTNPHRAIGTIALSADGREIDISSLTGLINVERVWWDYDSTDPRHPPRWRNFEIWPGSLLYVNDTDEPQNGDTVRVWYTLPHTLNGLDSETTTTLPPADDSLVVTGAAANAALFRSAEISEVFTVDGWSPKRLREWGLLKMEDFEDGLRALARREASRASGIAEGPDLDRWEAEGVGWY